MRQLQAWPQPKLTPVEFRSSTGWSNADVYVFAVVDSDVHERYDALYTANCLFWVAAASALHALTQQSLRLTTVRKLAVPRCRSGSSAALSVSAQADRFDYVGTGKLESWALPRPVVLDTRRRARTVFIGCAELLGTRRWAGWSQMTSGTRSCW